MNPNELLPCPFCGGEAEVMRPAIGGYPYAMCLTRYCTGPKSTVEEVTAAWNTRAAVTDPQIATLQASNARLVEALLRDPAVIAALPEVQALIAAKLEEASDAFAKHPSIQMDRYHPQGSWRHSIHDAIRALITPDMAQALADRDERVRREAMDRAAGIADRWSIEAAEAIRAEMGEK